MKELAALIAVITLAWPATSTATKVGARAPKFGLPALKGGKTVRLADFAGKVVVVDFWASWCKPCKKELPELSRLQKKYAKHGLAILAISVDEEPEAARRFTKKVDGELRWLWDKGGKKVASRYNPPKMPTSYFIDRKGVIRYVHRGFEKSDLPKIKAEIRRLLAQ